MSPQSRMRDYAGTVIFTVLVMAVCISAVAAIHIVTAPRVIRNERFFLMQAVYEAAGHTSATERAAVEQWFSDSVMADDDAPGTFDIVEPGLGRGGRVVVASGPGLWGRITAAVGFSDSGALTGIAFTEQNETPGLGARIVEPWFTTQVTGKRPPLSLEPEGTRSTSPHEIDGITGASITSRAVRDIINRVADQPPANAGAQEAP